MALEFNESLHNDNNNAEKNLADFVTNCKL